MLSFNYLTFYHSQANQLSSLESKAKALRNTLEKIEPMDYKTLKSINDETTSIRKSLKVSHYINSLTCLPKFLSQIEVNASRHHDLEQSIRGSTVKINFEKSNDLLASLKADNDTIYMKVKFSIISINH